jgi:hypothetical protein
MAGLEPTVYRPTIGQPHPLTKSRLNLKHSHDNRSRQDSNEKTTGSRRTLTVHTVNNAKNVMPRPIKLKSVTDRQNTLLYVENVPWLDCRV